MSTNSVHNRLRVQDEAVAWPPHISVPVAFCGLYMGVAGFSGGFVSVGAAGMVAIGIALGFTGNLSARILVAMVLWATITGLTSISAGFGAVGFYVIVPAIFCLLFVALGQGLGMVSGALVRRNARPGIAPDEKTPRVPETDPANIG
ncbi:MAG: hypothetical protein WED00_04015 [Aquisalimonadaceae bacterium]